MWGKKITPCYISIGSFIICWFCNYENRSWHALLNIHDHFSYTNSSLLAMELVAWIHNHINNSTLYTSVPISLY